jgi:multiple sugar transport system permease protein
MVVAQSRRRARWRRYAEGYFFIGPWLIGLVLFTAGPMIASLVIALTQWDILTPAKFVGFGNFQQMLGEDLFWKSLYNTAYYTFIAVPLHVIWAFILALCLNMRLRGVNIFRTAYYLPALTPAVANAVLWMWVFNPEYGLLNALIDALGLPIHPGWLFDPVLSKPSFIIMSMWGVGGAMVIFLAGLQDVPEPLYEAAAIDGAGFWARFWNVTVPMVSPVIFFNLIMQTISSWQIFTSAFIMTNGQPLNSTLFYVLYLYREAFQYLHMGFASALAWVLFAIVLVFTLVQFKVSDRWVYYEGDLKR